MTPLEAIRVARTEGYDPALQQIIVLSDDPEFAYRFAQDVAGADLDTLEPIVLGSADPRTVYDFAVLKSERSGDIALLRERMWIASRPLCDGCRMRNTCCCLMPRNARGAWSDRRASPRNCTLS
jgi:hypothetical protein